MVNICCCTLDNSDIRVLNLLIMFTTYVLRLNDERSVSKTLNAMWKFRILGTL